ncbi:MAG: tetratricopeptide repeat protein [Nannocystaceae bacterium]
MDGVASTIRFRPSGLTSVARSVGIAALVGGIAAWMLGNRVHVELWAQAGIVAGAGAAGLGLATLRFRRRAPVMIELRADGLLVEWRGGRRREHRWAEVERAVLEEEPALAWRLTVADAPPLVLADDGLDPRAWGLLSRRLKAQLEGAGVPCEAIGEVARAFAAADAGDDDDVPRARIGESHDVDEADEVLEQLTAEEQARGALLAGETGQFYAHMLKLDALEPERSGAHMKVSLYAQALERGELRWLLFELWDVDHDARYELGGALASALGRGLEQRGVPLLAALAYSWSIDAEARAREEALLEALGVAGEALERAVLPHARSYYAERSAREPERADLLYRLARVEALLGEPEPALAHAREAEAQGLDDLELGVLIAGLLHALGRRDEALARLDAAIDAFPSRGEALALKGAWLADERDDLTGAIDCLQRAVARDPALVDARERLRGLIRRLSTRA